MPKTSNRLAVERIHWLEVFPVLRLGSAFRHALQPGKLIIALLAVVLIHLSGSLLDWIWAEAVNDQSGERGVYESLVHVQGVELTRLFESAVHLELGLGREPGVFDALFAVVWNTPRSAFAEHPWFMLLFGADVLFVLAIASGIMCRMSATQVCLGKLTGLSRATRFVAARWLWYLLTPMLPTCLAVLLSLVLMLAGLVFFNVQVLDVVGSLLYGLMLAIGFVIVLVGFVLLFAVFLMPPAMSVEGTDAFDAIARAFNYVLFKPWQYAGYLVGSVVYLAVVYFIVVMLAGLTVYATNELVNVGSFSAFGPGSETHFEEIVGSGRGDDAGTIPTSAWIVARWGELLSALVLALMFSVVCSLQTQIYVLMRRCADGAPLDECAKDDAQNLWSSPEDMVDPVAQAIAASGPKGHPKPDSEEAKPNEPASED